jgi:hypothetical protein
MPNNSLKSKTKFNFVKESAALNNELQEIRSKNQQNRSKNFLTRKAKKNINKFLSESEAERLYKNLNSGKINSNEIEDIIRDTRPAAINNKNKTLTNLEKKDLAKYLGYWNKKALLNLRKGLRVKELLNAESQLMTNLNKLATKAPGNTFKNRKKLIEKILLDNKNPNYLNTTRKKSGFLSSFLGAFGAASAL